MLPPGASYELTACRPSDIEEHVGVFWTLTLNTRDSTPNTRDSTPNTRDSNTKHSGLYTEHSGLCTEHSGLWATNSHLTSRYCQPSSVIRACTSPTATSAAEATMKLLRKRRLPGEGTYESPRNQIHGLNRVPSLVGSLSNGRKHRIWCNLPRGPCPIVVRYHFKDIVHSRVTATAAVKAEGHGAEAGTT